jgi:hypothetical protein
MFSLFVLPKLTSMYRILVQDWLMAHKPYRSCKLLVVCVIIYGKHSLMFIHQLKFLHIFLLIISINVFTLWHYILTNFALLEYPVLQYVKITIKVKCNAVDVREILNSFYIIWDIFCISKVISLYILLSWKLAPPINFRLFPW